MGRGAVRPSSLTLSSSSSSPSRLESRESGDAKDATQSCKYHLSQHKHQHQHQQLPLRQNFDHQYQREGNQPAGKHGSTMPRRRSYKPIALRWPFLMAQIVMLSVGIVVVIVLQKSMPDSDNTALIDSNLTVTLVRRIETMSTSSGSMEISTMETSTMEPSTVLVTFGTGGPERTDANSIGRPTDGSSYPLTIFKGGSAVLTITGPGYVPTISRASRPPQRTFEPSITGAATSTAARSLPSGTTITLPVDRSDPAFADGSATVVKEAVPLSTAAKVQTSGDSSDEHDTARTVQSKPDLVSKTVEVVIGAVTATKIMISPPQTSLDALGVPIVLAPTSETIVAVYGGRVVSSVVVDDGLGIETHPVVTAVGGTPTTVVSRPQPQTVVSELNGVMVTSVNMPPPQTLVMTVGGSLVTLLAVTNTIPRQVITTAVATTIDGDLTTVPTVLTITPSPSTRLSLPTAAVLTTSPAASDGSTASSDPNNGSTTITRELPGYSNLEYLSGTFLPTVFAVILTIPISIIDLNVKRFQPFCALARSHGANGPEAMTLHYEGVNAILTPVMQLATQGQLVPLISTLLLGLSWTLTPLAAEAIGFKLHGMCSHLSISGCGISIGVSPQPTYALVAALAAMIALLALLAVLLSRWDTGLYSNPWSIAGMAALMQDHHLREPLVRANEPTEAELVEMFRNGRFRLKWFATNNDETEGEKKGDEHEPQSFRYGIVPLENDYWQSEGTHKEKPGVEREWHRRRHVPFMSLTYTWRIIFMVFLLCLIAMIVYYNLLREDNAFELFMDSQTFGVKFLFAAIGGIISFFWTSFFINVATVTPFLLLEKRARSAEKSILLTQPTNAFYGAYAAARQGNGLLLVAALTAVAGELLPILLANVPFALTQTLRTHKACAYLSLAVLAAMVLVLVASMIWVPWPHMPVDPRTLAGAAYYVADSPLLLADAQRGMSREDPCGQRDEQVAAGDRRYFYGEVVGSSGRMRMVIDRV